MAKSFLLFLTLSPSTSALTWRIVCVVTPIIQENTGAASSALMASINRSGCVTYWGFQDKAFEWCIKIILLQIFI